MTRKAKVKVGTEAPPPGDLTPWLVAMGLSATGGPLPPQEVAQRALEQQLADEKQAVERAAKSPVPFYRLPLAKDM